MNIERLTKLAEWLEAGALHNTLTFDMATGISYLEPVTPDTAPVCKTACCIAGATVYFFAPESVNDMLHHELDGYSFAMRDHTINWDYVADKAVELLELSRPTCMELFLPDVSWKLKNYSDPAWAARVIRNLMATGRVDWEACK